ncbi:unnamed protein product [Arabidopsis lyrata]|nr:unnamed protein product [Arabidopsis lyrata]
MALGRKRGMNKAMAIGELILGDLVLAKVKGFPAWPAKLLFLVLRLPFGLCSWLSIIC